MIRCIELLFQAIDFLSHHVIFVTEFHYHCAAENIRKHAAPVFFLDYFHLALERHIFCQYLIPRFLPFITTKFHLQSISPVISILKGCFESKLPQRKPRSTNISRTDLPLKRLPGALKKTSPFLEV